MRLAFKKISFLFVTIKVSKKKDSPDSLVSKEEIVGLVFFDLFLFVLHL